MQIKDFEDYTLSRSGVIKNAHGHILKPWLNSTGYPCVGLRRGGKKYNLRVHRLLAMHYLPNPKGLPEVNHKDEDKSNFELTNLEWCTRQYNMEYTLARNYIFLNPQGVEVVIYNLAAFCRLNKLCNSAMSKVYKSKANSHKGWKATTRGN